MNSEIKINFMEECYKGMKSKDFMEQELFTCEEAEEITGKDIACFTHDEICEMYKGFNLTNKVTLQRRNGVFKKYTKYCMDHNIFPEITANPYEEFDLAVIATFVKRNEINEEDMYKFLSESLNPIDKLLVVAAFNGISSSEIMLAKYEHIHNGTLQCYELDENYNLKPSRKVRVDNQFLQYAWETENADSIKSIYKDKVIVKRKLYGSYLFKESKITSETLTENKWELREYMFSKKWIGISNSSSKKLNYTSVFRLGIQHVILQQMELKMCTLQELLTPNFIKKLNNKFGIDKKLSFYEELMKEH